MAKTFKKFVAAALAVVMTMGVYSASMVSLAATARAEAINAQVMPLDETDTNTEDTNTDSSDSDIPSFKVGDTVRLKDGAKDYYGESISTLNSLWDYEVTEIDGDKVTILTVYLGIYKVYKDVHASDIILVKAADDDSDSDKINQDDERIAVGSTVSIKLDAKDYDGNNIKSIWYALTYEVTEIKGDKAHIETLLTPSVLEQYGLDKESLAQIFDLDPDNIVLTIIYDTIMGLGYTLSFDMHIEDLNLISGGYTISEFTPGTYKTMEEISLYEITTDSDNNKVYTNKVIANIPKDYKLVVTEASKGGYACVYYGTSANDGLYGYIDMMKLDIVSTEATLSNASIRIGNIVNISENCKKYYNGKTFEEVGVVRERISTPSIYNTQFTVSAFLGDAVVIKARSASLSTNENYNTIIVGADDIYFTNGTYKNTAQATTYTYSSLKDEFEISDLVIPANSSLYYIGETGLDIDEAVLSVIYKGKLSYVAANSLEFVSTAKTVLGDIKIGDEVYLDPEVTRDYWNTKFSDYTVSWKTYFGSAYTEALLHNAKYEVVDAYNDFLELRETSKSADENGRKVEPSETYDIFVKIGDVSTEKYSGTTVYGDADLDGEVKMSDVTLIQRAVADLTTLNSAQKRAADVDGSDDVSMLDVVLIQQYIASLITKFPADK